MTTQTSLPLNLGLAREDGLPAGYRLQGFEVEGVLTRSSVAVVYRGLDLARALPVVIKEFLPSALVRRGARHSAVLRDEADTTVFERARQAFVDEGRLLERCRHRSLMRVLQVLEENGTAYRVMPDCPGPTLLELRRNMAEPPIEKLLRSWLESLLGALSELHAAGRVHAAVAPGNILVMPNDCPLLLDSNAVRVALVSDQTRGLIATLPPCVAPREQTEPGLNRPLGPWTDLYSLAATLHFCMTGDATGTAERGGWPRMLESSSAPVLRPAATQASHSVGPAWLAALSTCLAENPDERPQSVAQLRRLFDIERLRRPSATATASSGLALQQTNPSKVGKDAPDASPSASIAPMADSLGAAQPDPNRLAAPDADGGLTDPADAGLVAPTAALGMAQPSVAEPVESAAAGRGGHARARKVAAVGVVLLLAAITGAYTWLQRSPQSPQASAAPATSTGLKVAEPQVKGALAPPAKATAVQDAPEVESQKAIPAPPALAAQPKAVGAARRAPSPAAPPAAAKTPPAKARVAATTPREACGNRTRFALYQCMQEQCAKPAWAKHAQCVQLRKEQKLG